MLRAEAGPSVFLSNRCTRCIDSIHYYPRQTLNTINCEDDGNSTREQHGTVAPPVLLQVRSRFQPQKAEPVSAAPDARHDQLRRRRQPHAGTARDRRAPRTPPGAVGGCPFLYPISLGNSPDLDPLFQVIFFTKLIPSQSQFFGIVVSWGFDMCTSHCLGD